MSPSLGHVSFCLGNYSNFRPIFRKTFPQHWGGRPTLSSAWARRVERASDFLLFLRPKIPPIPPAIRRIILLQMTRRTRQSVVGN